MYRPTKTLFTQLILSLVTVIALAITGYSQERQVEVHIDRSKGQATSLGGRVWLDLNDRMRVVGDIDFSQATNLFLNPTDQVEVQGKMWVFLTPFDGSKKSQTRPFVFGGASATRFFGFNRNVNPTIAANDTNAVQIPAGLGIQHFRSSGFEFTPTVEFTTKDMGDLNPVLGNAYTANVFVKIPLSKEFRLSLNPYVSRQVINSLSTTIYGAKIGFIRTF